MNLRDWASNDRTFINTIPECDRAGRKQMKVLGMLWDQEEDTLQFPKIKLTSVTTKRQVVQAVSTVFDPLGLVSPTMLISKLFLQSLWKDHLSWDDELSPNQLQQWQSRASELEQISDLSIPRILVSGSEYNNCQMLCFCDASKDAYAAVVYLRVASNNVTKVSLIFAKTRLAPTKSISIPRLELLAMVIGVRAMNFVEKQLHLTINAKYIWSDSKCVLHWIRSPKPLSLFVSNRVKEIKTQVNTNFRYVNSIIRQKTQLTLHPEVCHILNLVNAISGGTALTGCWKILHFGLTGTSTRLIRKRYKLSTVSPMPGFCLKLTYLL